MSMHISELVLIVGVVIAIPLTFLWMAAHVYGLVKLGSGLNHISRRAGITWLIAAVSSFMGPCVIPMSAVTLVAAILERRKDDVSPQTTLALRTIIITSTIMLVMCAVLIVASLGSVFLSR
ncbi:MAG: hypothetical protein ACI8RZ_001322 [Myxococcota bacterium]